MGISIHRREVKVFLLAVLLLAPAISEATGALDSTVMLKGVRSHVAHANVEAWSAAVLNCSACATPIPANEWFWLDPANLDSPSGLVLVAIKYQEGETPRRLLEIVWETDGGAFLVPPGREDETAIVVEVQAIPFSSTHAARRHTFPIAGAMPPDPREIRLMPINEWQHYELMSVGEDERSFLLWKSDGHEEASPQGWVFDYVDERAVSGVVWANGYDLGHGGGFGGFRTSTTPPRLDVSVVPSSFHEGAWVDFGFMGRTPVDRIDFTYGFAGPTTADDAIVMFSVNDSFRVELKARGPLTTVGSEADGVRIRSGYANAQAAATTRSAADFSNVSFVAAGATGGSLGSGTARIAHGDEAVSMRIDNLGRMLSVVSAGDCSGSWSASLSGTTVGGPSTFGASLLAATGYVPSPEFRESWHTDNGWCA